ncbi:fused glucose-specific PTS enzymes: IIBcomponent; IIC component [Planktothrix serta PCC 8927]|uniref:Fused glucose-specific PTS enzymes: IIBcomponent IIC component n=1 Tax=Planktothrix serta PCC 8927 TaxID=671068 RepID=A0A7Z9BKZ5_9CYAN|nr:glucose-specific PTS transporter subunit IIBC [Planktothrix serta]VXD13374.1 fused glucose-specific PTS enzymes: IIBcomponent; IIC component [Planktothrix serta PCC 8927]
MLKNAFALLQKMGKSLMLPVSVLPIAGLLLGLGSARLIEIQNLASGTISSPKFWWLPDWLANIMKTAGDAIFGNLPIIFAISVAIGFAENDGVAALAATVGFVVFVAALGAASTTLFGFNPDDLVKVMGIPSLDTGVFGGLIMGCVAAYLFNRFFRIQLPQYLGFFAGKRFVPIVTSFAAIAMGILMSVIWPPIGDAISTAANAAASGGNVSITAAIYGVVERLLLPFGLHHIWNVPFFFQIGSFTDPITNRVVTGDINRFFAGDPTAGILGGAYWFKMFGLPAAAIAIWRAAKPKNRVLTGGIMISAAFTSFLTGITEPIEFSFMFVAPPLYAVHALMAGFCDWLFVALGGRMGFTFSQGFIDFFLFNSLGTKAWLIPALGPFFAALYFCVFYFGIRQFNFSTPGREEDVETVETTAGTGVGSMAMELVRAFGGRSNIATLDACITRLRITVNDIKKVNKNRLKALGASGVLEIGNSAQAIFGPRSENLKTDMIEYLKVAGPEADIVEEITPETTEVNSTSNDAILPTITLDAEAKNRIQEMIIALGGKQNIQSIDAVALTRLRVKIIDSNLVNENALKTAGVEGVLRLPDGILHLLVGLGAEQYAAQIQD